MRNLLPAVGLTCLAAMLGFCSSADGIGRGGGSRGGGMPAVHKPHVQTPSIARPMTPSRPSLPESRPSAIPGNIGLPGAGSVKSRVPGLGDQGNLHLPGNAHLPTELPKNRPEVIHPGKLGSAKDRFPEMGNGKRPDIGMLPDKKLRDIGDLQKKNPGLFDRPKNDGKFAGKGPSKEDLSNWMGLPKDRPDFSVDPPVNRPGRDKINAGFKNSWKNAIGGDNQVNIGNKKVGDINVDLSKNTNFTDLSRHANVVHNNIRPVQNNWFNQNWWNNSRHTWPPGHYHYYPRPAAYWWRPCSWATWTAFMVGASWSPPVYYDYGTNVVIQQDVVYVNEQPVASAPVYAQDAIDLANVEPAPSDAQVEWMPVGTFALANKKDDGNPNTILQLALSKDGLVSGVWFNRSTESSTEVEGRVNAETQRVALRKPDQPDVVLEVGVYNLTQVATPCLIHFGTMQTQTWYLTRLEAQE